MEGPVNPGYNNRSHQIRQIQLRQQERNLSSPNHILDFSKPENFQLKNPEATHIDDYNRELKNIFAGNDSGFPEKGFRMSGYHRDQKGQSPSRTDPYKGDGRVFSGKPINSSDYHDNGLRTDDEKMKGKDRDVNKTDSDDEAERRLEMLRQLHEQTEATRLREESNEDSDDPKDEDEIEEDPRHQHESEGDSGSATPTNRYSEDQYNDTITDLHSVDAPHKANVKQNMGQRPPSNGKVIHTLSQKHYLHPLPSSEPSYSRSPSPATEELNRSQSHPYLRLIYDSNDLSSDSGRTSVADPGITLDRYARRACRASVLSKAEKLLSYRRQGKLDSISESGGASPTRREAQNLSGLEPHWRKGAFTQGGEATGETMIGGENSPDPPSTFRSDSTRLSENPLRIGGSQLQLQLIKAKVRSDGFSNQRRKIPYRRVRRRRKPPGHSLSDLDQFSSGSEDEVVRYGSRGNDNPSRYELSNVHPQEQLAPDADQSIKRARRVWFFRNGDSDFKAKQLVISQKTYPNFETLLVGLGQLVPTVAGVNYIFSWPEGKEVKSVTELHNGCYYVCASVNRLTRVNYGNSREQLWKGGKFKYEEGHLFIKANGTVVSSPNNPRPRVITVISNLYRDSHEKLILNPNTMQSFEDVLADIQSMIIIPHPPVKALFTEDKPHIKVESFTQLFRELKDHKNFLVCGDEGVPIEPKKRPSPSSNSSNDSMAGKGTRRSSKQAKGEIARGGNNSQSPSRRPRTEAVSCNINGKKRNFFAPSIPFLDNDGKKPDVQLKLEWVYGFRGRDVKQNLVILPNTGELVYFVAAVVVLYDRKTHTQKHYTSHTEEVTCLALHPRYPYIASGQVAGNSPEGAAHVRVWDGIRLSTYAVIGIGLFQQGVSCLSFSEGDTNGDLLLVIDDSDRHVMSVWEWTREDLDQPSAKTATTNDPVVFGCFYPFDDKILITFGRQHLYFWTVFWNRMDGKILRDKKSGLFEDELPKFVTSVCFATNRDVITGDSTGSILVWSPDDDDIFRIDRQASTPMKFAHKKSVSSLVMLSDGVLLSGGGSEIKAWDSLLRFKLLKERVLPDVYGTIRKLAPVTATGVDGYMFVGTAKDVILEGSLQSKFRPIVQGHSEELWAVKAHPTEPSFFTAGHDCSLIKWSADRHTVLWATKDKKPCTCIAVDPLGQLVAVGTTSGKVTLYGCGDSDGRERNSFQVGQAQVNAISFSPDGSQLAIGSHDGFVHVYVIHESGQIFRQQSAALRHNSTFIMHLDWSCDARYIQTVLGDYELVFWDVQNMQKLKTGRTLRDVNWSTFSCPVGYPLLGTWQAIERGEVINVACRSKYLEYIVTGDSRGRLRLYKYPCTTPKAEYRQAKPFSSNTTAAEFLSDDGGILASGGNDAALMQFAFVSR